MGMTTKEVTKLQKEWYKKLKDDGFQDLEYCDRSMSPYDLLRGGSKFSPIHDTQTGKEGAEVEFNATESYYMRARSFTHTGEFKTEIHKEVWRQFAEGLSIRAIGTNVGFSHSKVKRILDKYKPLIL